MRHNRSQSKQRRSHHGLEAAALSKCSNCGALQRPHHMCLECGFYNGRQVLDLAAEKTKREARMQAKREQISALANQPSGPETAPEPEVPMKDIASTKEAKGENLQDNKPEEAPIKQPKS